MRTPLFLLLTCLKSVDVFSQQTKYQNRDSLLADLERLTTTIRENHPMMNAYISMDKFDMIADGMAIRIGNR